MLKPTRTNFTILIALLLLILSIGLVLAAGETLSRSVIDSGGGEMTTGTLTLASSIGQPVAGIVPNGSLTLCSGFQCEPGMTTAVSHTIYLPTILK